LNEFFQVISHNTYIYFFKILNEFFLFLLTSAKYRKVAMNFVQQFCAGRIACPDQGICIIPLTTTIEISLMIF